MDRRAFLAAGGLASLQGFSLSPVVSSRAFADVKQATNNGNVRQPVLVRDGFTRKPDGTDERAPAQPGMFDIEVVRSSDSDGRIAAFVFPAADQVHCVNLVCESSADNCPFFV